MIPLTWYLTLAAVGYSASFVAALARRKPLGC